MHGKHTDEKRRAKQFKMEQQNGCTDEENFCVAAVKWMHRWRKFLHRCSQTDIQLTADGNFWTDAIKIMIWNHPMQMDAIFFCTDSPGRLNDWAPNPFEWLMHGIQMAIRWKPQTTRNVFAWEVTILFSLYSFPLSLNPVDIIVWMKICLFSSVLIIICLPSRL